MEIIQIEDIVREDFTRSFAVRVDGRPDFIFHAAARCVRAHEKQEKEDFFRKVSKIIAKIFSEKDK
jgi:hypothetical protein